MKFGKINSGLRADTTVTIPTGSTRAEIQTIFDDLPHNLNAHELRVIFEDGDYALDKPIVLIGFVNGYLRIYGNSSDGATVEDKAVTFSPTDAFESSNTKDDVAGINGLFVVYNCDKIVFRYIQLEALNSATRTAIIGGIYCKTETNATIQYCTFTADGSKVASCLNTLVNSAMYAASNFMGGWDYGINTFTSSSVTATGNKSTTTDKTDNNHRVLVQDASFVDFKDNNTDTYSGAVEIQRNGGFLVQDVINNSSETSQYELAFDDTNLVAGILEVTHNLNEMFVDVQIANNDNKLINPDDITYTSTSVTTIDLTTYGPLTGETWNLKIRK